MDLELNYYNQKRIWDVYSNNLNETNRAKEIVRSLPNDVESVLDIGCGNGILTNMINKKFVLGIDFAVVPLKNVKNNAICASITSLPIKKRKFDLILTTEVLEHLCDQDYIKALQEINNHMAKYLMITVPFEEDLEAAKCKCRSCKFIFNAFHHYRKFTKNWYIQEFPDYDVVFVKYSSPRILPNSRIIQLKHDFGVYTYSDSFCCPKCGGRPLQPHRIFRMIFGGLNLLDKKIKIILRLQRPYHQIVLLQRKNDKEYR